MAKRSLIVTGFPTIGRSFSKEIPVVPKGNLDLLRNALDLVLGRGRRA